ncbi:unnamed protein product, partial [Medioppia subpectinata]
WTEADKKCRADHSNGSLLFIEDSYEYSFIKYWTQSEMKSIEFWIGLNANNNTFNLQYQWANEWPVYHTPWAAGEPKYRFESDRQCVIQDRVSGLWRSNAYCGDRRAFVCKVGEISTPGESPYVQALCPTYVNVSAGRSGVGGTTNDQWINLHKPSPKCHWFSDTLALNWFV